MEAFGGTCTKLLEDRSRKSCIRVGLRFQSLVPDHYRLHDQTSQCGSSCPRHEDDRAGQKDAKTSGSGHFVDGGSSTIPRWRCKSSCLPSSVRPRIGLRRTAIGRVHWVSALPLAWATICRTFDR